MAGTMALSSINPATDQPIRVYEEASSEAVATALSAAAAAAARWRRVPFSRRAEPLRRAGALLRERREDLVLLMTLEMGKPLAQGRAEADKCAWVCEHYAEHAEAFLAAEAVSTEARKSDIRLRAPRRRPTPASPSEGFGTPATVASSASSASASS